MTELIKQRVSNLKVNIFVALEINETVNNKDRNANDSRQRKFSIKKANCVFGSSKLKRPSVENE